MKRIIAAVLCVGSLFLLCACGGIAGTYEKAQDALAKGNYQQAAELLEGISAYEDASKLALYARALLYGEQKDYEKAIDTLAFLGDYKDSLQLTYYFAVCRLSESGNIDDILAASKQFETMIAYRDSAEKAEKCRQRVYDEAVSRLAMFDYETAQRIFAALGDYKDSTNKEVEAKNAYAYAKAESLLADRNYVEAIQAFSALNGYKDSAEKMVEIPQTLLREAQIGSCVLFGSYEQDNNIANGKEIIEWVVLAKEGNRVLVISRYALDRKQYNIYKESVTWETCSLRRWLNDSFMNTAFSAEEQIMIPTVTVGADQNLDYSTDQGNDTADRVFLLSISEANEYFSSDRDRKCQGTAYCCAQGGFNYRNEISWWLRSLGDYSGLAADVDAGGSIIINGNFINDFYDAVRPALWIELSS